MSKDGKERMSDVPAGSLSDDSDFMGSDDEDDWNCSVKHDDSCPNLSIVIVGSAARKSDVRIKRVNIDGVRLLLRIYDASGFEALSEAFPVSVFRQAQLLFMCCDVAEEGFPESCGRWIDFARENGFKGKMIAVGDRNNAKADVVASSDKACKFFCEMSPPVLYFESSTKRRKGVEEFIEVSLKIWMKEVVAEHEKVQKRPVFAETNSSNVCCICGTPFTLFNRKHHCFNCGVLVDLQCTEKKALPALGYDEPVIVCRLCLARSKLYSAVVKAISERDINRKQRMISSSTSSAPLKVAIALTGKSLFGGKTSLAKRYLSDSAVVASSTTAMEVRVKEMRVNGFPLQLHLYDTSGLKQFRETIVSHIYSAVQIVFVCHDVNDGSFLETCKKWIQLARSSGFKGKLVVVGTKIDLVSQKKRIVSCDEARKVFGEMNPSVPYFETSAQTGEGVNELFENVLRSVVSEKRKFALPSTYVFEKLLEHPSCTELKASVYRFLKNFKKATKGNENFETSTVYCFLKDVEQEMRSLVPWSDLPDNHFFLAKDQMEKFIYGNIYPIIFVKKEYRVKDLAIRKHHDEIKPFVTPSFLGMDDRIAKSEFIPTAIEVLNQIDLFQTPSEKLECVFSACKILSYMLNGFGLSSSVDDFILVLIYVVVNTPFKSLYSNLRFIELYVADEDKNSQPYCFFTSLYTAVRSLENESVDSIKKTMQQKKERRQGKKEQERNDKVEECDGNKDVKGDDGDDDVDDDFLESSPSDSFCLELPKEKVDEWTNTLSRLEPRKRKWEQSPLSCVMIADTTESDIDESFYTLPSFEEDKVKSEKNDVFFFGKSGSQIPVNTDLKATIRLTLKDSVKTSFKIATRKCLSYKYTLVANPSEGTLTSRGSVDVQLVFRVMYTTTFDLCIPIVIWRGASDAYEKVVVNGRGKPEDVFVCQLESKIQSLPSTRLDAKELVLYRPPIGHGGNGTVYRGSYRGISVACKVLKDQEFLTKEQFREFRREAEMFEALRHPCIVTFIGAVFIPRSLSLVTEYCEYGSLDSAMEKYGPSIWTFKMKIKALFDAARAIDFLHHSSIIHRDVKPENLLVSSLEPNSSVICKLSDFGTTKGATDMNEGNMTRATGTPLYESPEVLKGDVNYNNTVDVYSFGITMASIADDGKEPFRELPPMSSWKFSNTVIEGMRPVVECESELPPDYVSLMHACWDADPTKRPDFAFIVEKLIALKNSIQ